VFTFTLILKQQQERDLYFGFSNLFLFSIYTCIIHTVFLLFAVYINFLLNYSNHYTNHCSQLKMAGKRKAPETLSTNLHTVKARNRQVGMTAADLQLDKAKKADSTAVTYTLGRLRASAE
jgi:hypothetical protein